MSRIHRAQLSVALFLNRNESDSTGKKAIRTDDDRYGAGAGDYR